MSSWMCILVVTVVKCLVGGRSVHNPTSLHSSCAQSAAPITLSDMNDGIRGDTFVCATSCDCLIHRRFSFPVRYNVPRL